MTAEHEPDGCGDSERAARARLAEAMASHAQGAIEDALALAADAVRLCPTLAAAHAYVGNTLVTRRRRFADGLAALERAADLDAGDATIWYTLGWCREYAAHAIGRGRGRYQATGQDSPELYGLARDALLRARALEPDDALLGDIEDMLDVIAAATGEPWSTEPVERAAPRERRAR